MLMDKLKEKSKSDLSLTLIVCETQTKNTPAIKFYISQGFQLDGIDVSYYGDDGLKNQNVAIFFKFRLNQ
jgi:ribosomal protein S18 acetylase RimI-like enzyme